ncbi:MAG: hypothetical protein WC810_27045 [Janthinobacterium sp.]|jgi:hypothetical protein
MDTLIKADVFFFITSIAVVIGAILLIIILIYGIFIFKDLLAISNKVKHEAELIAMDIDEAREHIKQKASDFSSIMGFLKGIFGMGKTKRKKKSE